MDFFSILTLIGGLSLFLYGMNSMGDGLKKLSGGQLETVLGRLTATRFKAFLLGFLVTAVIQSSSATTVMLVGFVNSGLMRLGQTISIIMGANVGTTVTSWLLSLAGISGESFFIRIFKPSSFTPILAAIGVILSITAKTEKRRNIATILLGFSILMFGMETMSSSMDGLKDSTAFQQILIMFSNPLLGILSGTLLTAVIQSSSASVGILQALSLTGAIPFSTAIPIILGQNIGTTITPILSAINGNKDARRVALACLYIKMIGVLIIACLFYGLNAFLHFQFLEQHAGVMSIAVIHTLFNLLSTVILLPFCSGIEKLTLHTIPGKEKTQPDVFDKLDDRFLSMPSFAVEKCRDLVCEMARIAQASFHDAVALIWQYDKEQSEQIQKSEELVDTYEDKISTYLVKLASKSLPEKDSMEVTQLLHVIGDVERISDHALNIQETAQEVYTKSIEFSPMAAHELSVIISATQEVMQMATDALIHNDLELAKKVEPLEELIDKLKMKIKNNHIHRLRDGECTIELGFVLSDLLTNLERAADHCSNIAVCLLEIAHHSFETHEYLNHVKAEGENAFFEQYQAYKQKYRL